MKTSIKPSRIRVATIICLHAAVLVGAKPSASDGGANLFAVTNLESAVQALGKVHVLWPDQDVDYFETLEIIADQLYADRTNAIAISAAQKMFDDALALETLHFGRVDEDNFFYSKVRALYAAFHAPSVTRNPTNWLAIAKYVAKLKSELNPALRYRMNNLGWEYHYSDLPKEEKDKMLQEHLRKRTLGTYQTQLPMAINRFIAELGWRAHSAEFDDDTKRHEFRNELIKLAKLSADDIKEAFGLDVSKRLYPPPGQENSTLWWESLPPMKDRPGSPEYTPPPAAKKPASQEKTSKPAPQSKDKPAAAKPAQKPASTPAPQKR